MMYTVMDIIKEFNVEMIKLVNDGWILIPHTYSNGIIHENFIKGNESKVLEIYSSSINEDDDPWIRFRENKTIRICTSKFDDNLYQIANVRDYSSWDFKKKDCATEIIHKFYKVQDSYKCNVYVDTYDEIREIIKIQKQRHNEFYSWDNYETINLPITDAALRFMRKQPKCKTIKLNDVERVEKRIYKTGLITYSIYAKGRSYEMH